MGILTIHNSACTLATTTTTGVPATTTTTVGGTTSTTTVSEAQAVETCLTNSLVFEATLPFTPASTWWGGIYTYGSSVVEDSNYIYIGINDSQDNEYKYHRILRYSKIGGTIAYKQIMTTGGYYGDYHKLPALLISSSGALLVAIETLPYNGSHNSSIEVFRWADPSDLNTYTSTVIGPNLLAYNFLFEIGGKIVLECRRYPSYRVYYTSANDGVSFGAANQYISYGDTDYWMYSVQVGNNTKGDVLLAMIPQNDESNANCLKYVTYLRTDFTGDFYSLDGTNLGTVITGAELEAHASWGDTVKDTDLYQLACAKVFGNYIYGFGYVGIRSATVVDIQNWQLHKVDITTGAVTVGALIDPKFDTLYATTNAAGVAIMFNVCDELYLKISYSGTLHYYKVAEDLSDLTLVYEEDADFHQGIVGDMKSELNADFDDVLNKVRVFRMQDPDIVLNMTTTTTGTSVTTTTTVAGTTTTTVAGTTTTTEAATTTTTEATSLTASLVSVWEFNETSGTTLQDAHSSNDGTITGSYSLGQAGLLGNAVQLTDSSIDFSNPSAFQFNPFTESYTVSIWVKSADPSPTTSAVYLMDSRDITSNANMGYPFVWFAIASQSDNVWLAVDDGDTVIYPTITGSSVWNNNWHMITMVVSHVDGKIYAYLDAGTPVEASLSTLSSVDYSSNMPTTPQLILGRSVGDTNPYTGLLDQFAIWNRALTPSEISQLYNSGNGLAYASW